MDKIDFLTVVYEDYCTKHSLPYVSADEQDLTDLDQKHVEWLNNFNSVWEEGQQSSKKTSSTSGTRPLAIPQNLCHTYSMENKANNMKNKFQSLTEDSSFVNAIQGLQDFVLNTAADCDMAYDWVCDQAECSSFVADNAAWDMFYDAWETAAA